MLQGILIRRFTASVAILAMVAFYFSVPLNAMADSSSWGAAGNKIYNDTYKQGVLSFNTNRDTYQVGETAEFQYGVLDPEGRPVCDASIGLEIILPNGSIQQFSSGNAAIKNTGLCTDFDSMSIKPDYRSEFVFEQVGDYRLTITEGNKTLHSVVTVSEDLPYTIERHAATRLYPFGWSPMQVDVTFLERYEGVIEDRLPAGFEVKTSEGSVEKQEDGTSLIRWAVKAEAGETLSLNYQYDSPDVSPEFYEVGPLTLTSDNYLVYQESRTWQIANDAQTVSGTVYSDQGTTPYTTGDTVRILVNGVSAGTNTIDGSGNYSIVIATTPTVEDVITVYIDGGGIQAATVFLADGTTNPVAGVNLYQSHLIVRSESGSAVTNTNLDTGNDGDTDLTALYNDGGTTTLTTLAGSTLLVWTGDPYTPEGTVTVGGNMRVDGTFNPNGQNLSITGSFTQTAGTVTASTGTYSVGGSFILSGGTFNSTSGTLTFSGATWDTSGGGTFAANSGTVVFSGTSHTINGSSTFNNFTKANTTNNSTNETLTLTSGTTQTINGTLTLTGLDIDDFLILNSSSGGNVANFDLQGTATVATSVSMIVQDNAVLDNSSAFTGPINPQGGSISNGNNTNWFMTISGRVLDAPGGAGINGVQVRLINNGGLSTAIATTANNAAGGGQDGEYLFTELVVSDDAALQPFINNATENGTRITHYVDGDTYITGFDLYDGYILIDDENTGVNPVATSYTPGDPALDSDGTNDLSPLYSISPFTTTASTTFRILPGITFGDYEANVYNGNYENYGSSFLSAGGNTITFNGNFYNDASGTISSIGILFSGTSNQTITLNGDTFGNFQNSNTSGVVTIADNFGTTGTFTNDVGAIFSLAGNDFNPGGGFTNNGTIRLQGSETVTLNGANNGIAGTFEYVGDGTGAATTHTLTNFGATDFYNLVINDTSASNSDTFQPAAGFAVANNVTVTDGTLSFNGQTVDINGSVSIGASGTLLGTTSTATVAGNWNNAGTFTAGTSTISLDGAADQDINGATTFNNFTIADTGARVLGFEQDVVQTIGGTFTCDLTTGNVGTIRTIDSGGTVLNDSSQSTINVTGTQGTVDFVDVRDNILQASGVTRNPELDPASSTNSGNTAGWFSASITYGSGSFAEAGANDGSITATDTITLVGDTFTVTSANLTRDTHYTIANLPSGLTEVLAVNAGGTAITLSFTGNAAAHANANDVSNLTITFLDAALTGGSAAAISGYTKNDIVINFRDTVTLTYGSGSFAEASANNGSITATDTITLANDTFTVTSANLTRNTHYTITNLPTGLTEVLAVNAGGTIITLSFTGNASSHANANDVSNLTITFLDAAFTGGFASAVTNYNKSDIAIDFNDPPSITYSATSFPEASPNDGTVTATGTLTLSGDTFTVTSNNLTLNTHYTVSNLPAGLTVQLAVNAGGTVATLSFTGSATSHANANDVSNLTITFLDAAFTGGSASGITNYTKNDLAIDFADPAATPTPTTTTTSGGGGGGGGGAGGGGGSAVLNNEGELCTPDFSEISPAHRSVVKRLLSVSFNADSHLDTEKLEVYVAGQLVEPTIVDHGNYYRIVATLDQPITSAQSVNIKLIGGAKGYNTTACQRETSIIVTVNPGATTSTPDSITTPTSIPTTTDIPDFSTAPGTPTVAPAPAPVVSNTSMITRDTLAVASTPSIPLASESKPEITVDRKQVIKECVGYNSERPLGFVDVTPDSPYANAINVLKNSYATNSDYGFANNYVVGGYGTINQRGLVTVGVNDRLDRIAMAKMVLISHCLQVFDVRNLPLETAYGDPMPIFTDLIPVKNGNTLHDEAVDIMYSAAYFGLISGGNQVKADPYGVVTVPEALKMLVRAGEFVRGETFARADERVNPNISRNRWYFEYYSKAVAEGILLGEVSNSVGELRRYQGFRMIVDAMLQNNLYQEDALPQVRRSL